MIQIFKTVEPDNELIQIDTIEKGCWINITSPTEEELMMIQNQLDVNPKLLRDPLDEEEKPRIDVEDDQIIVIVDIPYAYQDEESLRLETMPLGLLVLRDEYFISICAHEAAVLKPFMNKQVKDFFTYKKTRFIFQILYNNAKDYLKYLRQIDKRTEYLERSLHKSMRNKELFKLLELEKSLVFFTTSLKSNDVVLERLLRGKYIKLYEEDQDLLEDAIIENKQAIEMANIYSTIMNGMMDAFSSVISNNLNIVMKFLTSVTIVLSIPTIVFSFYGMNMYLPLANSPLSWLYIFIGTVVLSLVVVIILNRKQLL
ncbi:MAG: magnesium transporter CorA family protein [Clostridiaceae bacterium]|nr:magnesium transporter CorA family protein [Clostridiaceae bacterium]